MGRCVIIGGADIEDYNIVKSYLREDDFNIFCDSGLRHIGGLGVKPHLAVGDFDSFKIEDVKESELIRLPRRKDDTDTVFAVKEGLRRGFEEFLLIGVIGQRLDHTLVNVYALIMLDSLDKKAMIVDAYSEMVIVSDEPAYICDRYPYFSLVNITGTAEHINIENALFNLADGSIQPGYQYATSNEVLPGKTAKVTVGEGKLLLIKIRN